MCSCVYVLLEYYRIVFVMCTSILFDDTVTASSSIVYHDM